ncbi:MAG: GNAT family N-acetyltransferase [Anaerolineae bacterium]|nr:GNAT family N-acetyltransferase [Anaerolineae bacterium]
MVTLSDDQLPLGIMITRSRPQYAESMEMLQHRVYQTTPSVPEDSMRAEQFRHHMKVFPQGQFVAIDQLTNDVIGLTVSMRLDFDPEHPFIEPWHVTISDGWLMRHKPKGEWMYGVESCVHPAYRSMGVGGKLMEARFEVARRLNLRGMVAGSSLMGYRRYSDRLSPDEYVRGVVEGKFFDMNLSKQIAKGFRPMATIPHYVTDTEACGWGAVIVWHNPAYDPTQKPRRVIAKPYVYHPHAPQPEPDGTRAA